ncbi:MAG: hypothetical protein ACYTXI_28265 [Nostoc sp.]
MCLFSKEIGKAQAAIDTYLREQGAPERNSDDSMRQKLTLICYGEGRKPGIESRNSYEWNSRRHRYELQNRVESSTNEFDSEVQVEIRNMQGKIHLGGKLIPPIHSGGTNGMVEPRRSPCHTGANNGEIPGEWAKSSTC